MRKKPGIDRALDHLCKRMKPGETMTRRKIADACGCSHQLIYEIEKQALRKLRRRMRREDYLG